VLVTGGRDWFEWGLLEAKLSELKPTVIIQGGARGADQMARQYANSRGIYLITYHYLKQHDKRGGPMRNMFMLDDSRPHICVACPGGTGTASCVTLAKQAKVEITYV
jgi:hypothetical protein